MKTDRELIEALENIVQPYEYRLIELSKRVSNNLQI